MQDQIQNSESNESIDKQSIEEHSSCKDTVKITDQQDFSFFNENGMQIASKHNKSVEGRFNS